jgi:hypothetical protein
MIKDMSISHLIKEINQIKGCGILYLNGIQSGFWYNSTVHGIDNLYFYIISPPPQLNLENSQIICLVTIDFLNNSRITKIELLKLRDPQIENYFRAFLLSSIISHHTIKNYNTILSNILELFLSNLPSYLDLSSITDESIIPNNLDITNTSNCELDDHKFKETYDLLNSLIKKLEDSNINVNYNPNIISELEKKLFTHIISIRCESNGKWVSLI